MQILETYTKFINNDNFIHDVIRELIDKIIVYKDTTIQISFKFGVGKIKEIKLY